MFNINIRFDLSIIINFKFMGEHTFLDAPLKYEYFIILVVGIEFFEARIKEDVK